MACLCVERFPLTAEGHNDTRFTCQICQRVAYAPLYLINPVFNMRTQRVETGPTETPVEFRSRGFSPEALARIRADYRRQRVPRGFELQRDLFAIAA